MNNNMHSPAWGGGPLGRCPWPLWPGSLWGWVGWVGWGPGVPFSLRGRKSPLGVGCPRVAVVGRRRRLSSSSFAGGGGGSLGSLLPKA